MIIKTGNPAPSVNHFDYLMRYGDTALLLAAKSGYVAVVTTLIENGASVDHQNKYIKTFIEDFDYLMRRGKTALNLAGQNAHDLVVALLIKFGARD